MKALWRDARDIYSLAWAFAVACPLLFMIPVVFEFAQHVVEIQSGLYHSIASAKAAEHDSARMAWGFVKTLALGLPTYWFYRYIVSGRDPGYARRLDGRALALWGILFLVMAAINWLALFGPAIEDLTGLTGSAATAARIFLFVVQTAAGIYFAAWFVAWSQGNATIGPVRSARIMNGFFWRTVVLMVAGIVPLMALHYAGLFAIGRPEPVVWAVMLFDAFVVGFLALTMAGAGAVAARTAARSKGIGLMGAEEPVAEATEVRV